MEMSLTQVDYKEVTTAGLFQNVFTVYVTTVERLDVQIYR